MEHLSIEDSSWSKNLFKRMGYVRRLATTGKVEISEKLKAEIETAYLYGIVQKINENKIPSSLVINLDHRNLFLVATKLWQKKVVNQYRSPAQQINA